VEEFTADENAALYLSWLRFHATVVKRKLPHLTRTTTRTDMTSIHCYVVRSDITHTQDNKTVFYVKHGD